MNKPLFIVRNGDSPLFDSFELKSGDKSVVLVQNGVLLNDLRNKGAKTLKDDAVERGLDSGEMTDYDGLLDSVLDSSVVITI